MNEKDQCFLDTSFVVALLDNRDVHHRRALELHASIKRLNGELFLSDVVLNETLCVIARKYQGEAQHELLKKKLEFFSQHIRTMPILCLYELVNKSFGSIKNMILQTSGTLGFHDCLIVLFLQQIPLVHLVTFDEDFKKISGLSILS